MRAISVYFSRDEDDKRDFRYATADVVIPGIGKCSIKDCISIETMDRIFAEVEAAAKLKLNIVKPENKEY